MSLKTEIDLFNLALDELGQSPIESFEGNLPGTENARRKYDQVIGHLFELHPWKFLLKVVPLSRLPEPSPTKYDHQFSVPGNEPVHAVYNEKECRYPYRFFRFLDQRVHADPENLWAEIRRDRSPEEWPHTFRELCKFALAASACMQHTGDIRLRESLHRTAFGAPSENGFGGLVSQAKAIDSQSDAGGQLVLEPGELIDARYDGGLFDHGTRNSITD